MCIFVLCVFYCMSASLSFCCQFLLIFVVVCFCVFHVSCFGAIKDRDFFISEQSMHDGREYHLKSCFEFTVLSDAVL